MQGTAEVGVPVDARDDERRSGWRPRRGELMAIFAFWTFVAVLGVASRVVGSREAGSSMPSLTQPILLEAFQAYIWAVFTPVVFWLVARVRVERADWVRGALVLATAGLAISLFVDVTENVFQVHALGLGWGAAGTSPVLAVLRLWFLDDLMIFVGILGAGFARLYFLRYRARQDEAARLQAQAAVLEAQLSAARLEALRMQINPHFLFNTLHAISSLVDRDPDGVRRMIAHLAGLLRSTLREGAEQEVTLERELEFLEGYLEIVRIRFGGRLEVDFRIESDVLDAMVPNLILQPLVENAVKHGVSRTEGPSRVVVTAAAEDDRLVLAVLDDGPGLPDGAEPAAVGGIGLSNIRQRLSQLYGPAADLRLSAAPEGGARAQVRLPLRLEDKGVSSDARPPVPAGATGDA